MPSLSFLRHSLLHRIMAVAGVALVLILGILAVRPDWHEALCHHEPAEAVHDHEHEAAASGADTCVITQFAHGQVLALIALLLLFAGWVRVAAVGVPRSFVLVAFANQLPPGRGPPAV